MKFSNSLPIIIAFAMFFSCKKEETKIATPKPVVKPATTKEEEKTIPQIQYSEKELIAFMDSVAKLPSQPLQDKVSFRTDSIYKIQTNFDRQLSSLEFKQLKQAIKKEKIDLKFAERIFGKYTSDTSDVSEGKVPITLFSFDKNKSDYNEFALALGWIHEFDGNNLYFFKSGKLISKLIFHYRYDFELEHYKDKDGKTIVYHKENFQSGVGIWWYNYYFYQYDGDRLIPILNEVENSNLTWPGFRLLWIQSTVVKTNPLTLKMVYHQELFDTSRVETESKLINDSTFVKYNWNERTKKLEGDYAHSKISKPEILSYYLEDNELLFINTNYKLLKKELANPAQKARVLYYLNSAKNYCRNK
jgi:hypothetical protein